MMPKLSAVIFLNNIFSWNYFGFKLYMIHPVLHDTNSYSPYTEKTSNLFPFKLNGI